jgi:hypothetical protein
MQCKEEDWRMKACRGDSQTCCEKKLLSRKEEEISGAKSGPYIEKSDHPDHIKSLASNSS